MAEFWPTQAKISSNRMKRSIEQDDVVCKNIWEAMTGHSDVSTCNVIQIGAQNCALSKLIASKCQSLFIFDTNKDFLGCSRSNVGVQANVTFSDEDLFTTHHPADSANVVIIDEMFQYLDGKDVQTLLQCILVWLKNDGYFLCIEPCHSIKESFTKSADVKSLRRDFGFYHATFQTVTIGSDSLFGFEVVFSRTLQYKQKGSQEPTLWMWMKSSISQKRNPGFKTFHEFLDSKQYSINGILRYEKIFGRCYVSTGGADTTKKFVAKLKLKPGEKVLDVGCGIGGSAFHMAENYGAEVFGIDLSTNMISIAFQRCLEVNLAKNVTFELADATKRHLEPGSYDVVYSRDTILHIADKLSLFKDFFKWMKPGGRLLITDYCCSAGSHSDAFKAYMKQRVYNLEPVEEYRKLIEEAGFKNVDAIDMTDSFIEILHNEKNKVHNIKEEFIQEFSLDDYNAIISGWEEKVQRCKMGDQRWGFFMAEK